MISWYSYDEAHIESDWNSGEQFRAILALLFLFLDKNVCFVYSLETTLASY